MNYLAASDPRKVTVNQGHMPEIEFFDADHATGIGAMFDWVDGLGPAAADRSSVITTNATSAARTADGASRRCG